MKLCFLLFLNLLFSFEFSAQGCSDVNTLFELNVDSIERKVNIYKWGTDTSYYIHYSVKNISSDTLNYITNSCFYYNHSSLKVGNLEFDLNHDGGCFINSLNPHKLAPRESFSDSQWITANKLNELKKGELEITLLVPLIKDDQVSYRVDGRDFVENEQHFIFNGKTRVVGTIIDNRKRKKNKKQKRNL